MVEVAVVVVVVVVSCGLGPLANPPLARATTVTHGRTGSSRRRSKRLASTAQDDTIAGAAPDEPDAPPYGVGVSHLVVTDTTRSTPARGDTPASPVRAISVTLDYPTGGVPGGPVTPDAPVEAGAFPLVVLAHGYDVSAATYATMEEQLAAAGLVVAAPDFPLTSSALPGPADESDVSNQAADISFVITSLLDPDQTAAYVVAGAIAPTKVGVIGHSDGGVTAAAVAYNSSVADPRVGAAVVLSGAEARYDGTWFTTQSPPLLAIHGTDDEVNPIASSQQLFDDATGPKMLVTVDGGSHLGPFTTDPAEPAVAALAADFLRAHLEGDLAAASRVSSDATVPGVLEIGAAA